MASQLSSRTRFFSGVMCAGLLVACGTDTRESGGDDSDTDGIGIVSIGDDGSSSGFDESETSTDDTSSDESSTGEDVRYCGDVEVTVAPLVPRVMLVLDKSRSMVTSTWDHDADPSTEAVTRWYSLHETVSTVARDNEGIAELGAVFFPSRALADNASSTACRVEDAPDVAMDIDNADAIIDAMPAADSLAIYGGTPTTAGITVAADALRGVDTTDPRAIVLVTDGAANCSEDASQQTAFTLYDENLAPAVASIAAEGIPTYVIGIDIVDAFGQVPQANPHDRLSEVAEAGGRARAGDEPYFNTRSEAELTAALAEVATSLQCNLAVDDLPASGDGVHVRLDGAAIDQVDTCDTDGWRLADDGKVELCGNACTDFIDGASMSVAFDCVPAP